MNEIKRVLIHIRWPLQSFTLLGFLFGVVVSRANLSLDLILGFVAWFFLCAGIVIFNSYYDKDVNPVAGLENPPTATFSMLIGAWMLKLSGFIIALFLNKIFLLAYVTAVVLSVLYSHKNFRFKSNGYIAVIFNFISGAMTFVVASSFSLTNTAILFLGSITAGFFLAAIYLMMQVHQKEEDKTRGYTSIMILYGKKITLVSAICLMIITAVLSSITLILSGLHPLYFLIIVIYFVAILFISYVWSNKREESVSDFKTMNKLTISLSYTANLILITVYIFDILLKI